MQVAETQAVLVTFPFEGSDLSSIFALEDRLIEVIEHAAVGEFDGNEVGGGTCTLYMYGPNADQLFESIFPVLAQQDFPSGSYAIKRLGNPGAPEQRIELPTKAV